MESASGVLHELRYSQNPPVFFHTHCQVVGGGRSRCRRRSFAFGTEAAFYFPIPSLKTKVSTDQAKRFLWNCSRSMLFVVRTLRASPFVSFCSIRNNEIVANHRRKKSHSHR